MPAIATDAPLARQPLAAGPTDVLPATLAPTRPPSPTRTPLPAVGEERAIIQIFVNLMGNAIRHSPSGAAVRIEFHQTAKTVSVTVADQGSGIAPADRQRIFEKFERADEAPGGTGLGLAIARRLARSMGGDVTLDNSSGQGARFTLTLPKE